MKKANPKVEVLTVKADVSNLADCKASVQQIVDKFGRIDVLVYIP